MPITLAILFSISLALVNGGNDNLKRVSTTRVSRGALFGLAAGNERGKIKTIFTMLLSWINTLPLAAVLAFTAAKLFSAL